MDPGMPFVRAPYPHRLLGNNGTIKSDRQLHHDVTIEISSVEAIRLISSPPLSADSVQESVTKLAFRTLVTISRLR